MGVAGEGDPQGATANGLKARPGAGGHWGPLSLRAVLIALAAITLLVLVVGLPASRTARAVVAPSSSSTLAPTTTMPQSTSGTIANTGVPDGGLGTATPSGAVLSLESYVKTQAASDASAALAAGETWNGYLVSPPTQDAGTVVAVAAFSYDPHATPVEVLTYAGGKWIPLVRLSISFEQLPTPSGAAMSSYWIANYSQAKISVADVTGDGRPDFLIPLNAADNTPGVVLSQDGGAGTNGWRYVPFVQGASTTRWYIFARSPLFRNQTLQTTNLVCVPDCAQGTATTVVWKYDSNAGVFAEAAQS